MARIDAVTSVGADTAIQPAAERNRKGSQQNEVFSRQVKEHSQESWQEYMSELQGKIFDQGSRLGERMDLSELFKYRTLITEFFHETVDNGFSFDSESSFNARNRNKVFSTVKTVNEEINEIAKQLVSEQQDQLDVLERIDSIRGMILDMFL
ncbi:MAG: YaaR family protein [Clostridiaceae bacterium]|nr:YaaR family protein [Clostridiaceae bacterium]